jgi:hypothetical protein
MNMHREELKHHAHEFRLGIQQGVRRVQLLSRELSFPAQLPQCEELEVNHHQRQLNTNDLPAHHREARGFQRVRRLYLKAGRT